MYCAIIGDIVSSKEIQNRKDIQNKLNSELAFINMQYSEHIESNFTITLGDEFQGLMRNVDYLFVILERISNVISPVKIRYGIGLGEITTDIDSNISLGADGPAYHNARLALNDIKILEDDKKSIKTRIKIVLGNLDFSGLEHSINANLYSMYQIESSWTIKQYETILFKRRNENLKQNEIADKLGVEPSTILRSLKGANYNWYCALKEDVKDAMINIWEILND